VEARDYFSPVQSQAPLGRVRVLEDTDGDGVFDSGKVYADNLPRPSAIACYGGGVFVATAQQIVYLKDSRSDGLADIRTPMFSFANNGSNSFLGVNSFCWGMDHRVHAASGGSSGVVTAVGSSKPSQVELGLYNFSFDPRALDLQPEAGPSESGLSFDSQGRMFVTDRNHPLRMAQFDPAYLSRNPYFPRPNQFSDVAGPARAVYRLAPGGPVIVSSNTPPRSRAVTNLTLAGTSWMTDARGTLIYAGAAFPSNYLGNAFVADATANVIHRIVLRDNGLDVVGERAADEARSEFVSSADLQFHPMQLANGPDGAIYVADVRTGGESGRIYRIIPANFVQPKAMHLRRAPTSELVQVLASVNSWQRETSARLLYERADPSSIPLMSNVLYRAQIPGARLQALHGLEGLRALKEHHIARALSDPDARVREHGIRLSELAIRDGQISDVLWLPLSTLANDASARCRFQLVLTLGDIQRNERGTLLARILLHDWNDPRFHSAALSSIHEGSIDFFRALADAPQIRGNARGNIFLRDLAMQIGLQNRASDVEGLIDYLDRTELDPEQSFALIFGLGEGLHRAGSALALADPQARLQRFYVQANAAAVNDSLPEATRLAGIRALSVGPYGFSDTGDFLLLLFGSNQSVAVQAAALGTLGRFNDPRVVASLIARWRVINPSLHNQVIGILLQRADRVNVVLNAVQAGTLPVSAFSASQVAYLTSLRTPALSQRALSIFGAPSDSRSAVTQEYLGAMRLNGIPERGREIFDARCLPCHRLRGYGNDYGPDLSGIRTLGKQRILEDIIEPNHFIPSGYNTSVVETRDGEVYVGFVRDQNNATLTIRQPANQQLILARANIRSIDSQPWSLMPEQLEQGLTLQSMADLLEYLINPQPHP
jgi:putative membrane-bound dehydrogenase-like protein